MMMMMIIINNNNKGSVPFMGIMAYVNRKIKRN